MVAVALISAFITMRFAIHGREAVVPALTGLTVAEASKTAGNEGLKLTLENRFYSSDVLAGRILAQDPPPGAHVRREWPVRITESLGGERVNIPDLTGESERAATVTIRRLSLDLGTVAHIAVPGDTDVVLTQTPSVSSSGADGPRVSLLVSDSEANDLQTAYVMPSLTGVTYSVAAERASAVGLHLVVTLDNPQPATSPATSSTPASNPEPSATSSIPGNPVTTATPMNPGPPSRGSIILAQTPQPGRRVARGDAVHVTVSHTASDGTVSSQ